MLAAAAMHSSGKGGSVQSGGLGEGGTASQCIAVGRRSWVPGNMRWDTEEKRRKGREAKVVATAAAVSAGLPREKCSNRGGERTLGKRMACSRREEGGCMGYQNTRSLVEGVTWGRQEAGIWEAGGQPVQGARASTGYGLTNSKNASWVGGVGGGVHLGVQTHSYAREEGRQRSFRRSMYAGNGCKGHWGRSGRA